MNLSRHRSARLSDLMRTYRVSSNWSSTIYNYLVNGYEPGSFVTSLLANDALGAFANSHPSNEINDLKNLTNFIVNCLTPDVMYGSYSAVDTWIRMSDSDRRIALEKRRLIFTEKEEVFLILKDEPLRNIT